MTTTEQLVQRKNTRAFILAEPIDVVLIPRTITKSNTGAQQFTDGTPRAVQTVRLIPITEVQRPTVTVAGVERIADFTILLEWDGEIARNDYFVIGDAHYDVIELSPFNGYEVKALVAAHG